MKIKLLKKIRKHITVFYYPNMLESYVLVIRPTLSESFTNFSYSIHGLRVPYPKTSKSFRTLDDALGYILIIARSRYRKYSRKAKIELINSGEWLKKMNIKTKVWHR